MEPARGRWTGAAMTVALAALAAVFAERLVVGGQVGIYEPLAAGVFAAVGAFALAGYRSRRSPELLLLAAGGSAFAVQLMLAAAIVPAIASGTPSSVLGFAVYGPYLGSLALAGCLAAAVPWRERRGRPPLRPTSVLAAVVGPVVAADLLLLLLRPAPPLPSSLGGSGIGFAAAILLAATLAATGIAATRAASPTLGAPRPWIAGAALALAFAAIGTVLKYLLHGTAAIEIAVAWQAILPVVAAALLVTELLIRQRGEISWNRRETDRAAGVLEGRAEIASTIAHDVRGPVGTISGLALTIRRSYERLGDPQRLELIGLIEQESARLLGLVEKFALALKIDAGSLELSPRLQDVAPIVTGVVEAADAGEHPLAVDVPTGVVAPLDERRFAEAVREALDNALRYSPPDAPVAVTLRRGPDGGAVLTIVDQGPGVPEDRREAVFEKLGRWRPAGYEDRAGSGLGLFVCRGIARGHGGDAILGVAPAGGTMLRIRIPGEGPA